MNSVRCCQASEGGGRAQKRIVQNLNSNLW